MIDQKEWGEFLFALWKVIKKYQVVNDWPKFMDEADALMEKFTHPVHRGMILGFLEYKNYESMRPPTTDAEIEQMNSVHFPLVK